MKKNFTGILLALLLAFSPAAAQDWIWAPWSTTTEIKDVQGGVEGQMDQAAGTGFDCWALPGGECDLSTQTDSIQGVDGDSYCRRIDVVLTSGTYRKASCSTSDTICTLHEGTDGMMRRACCDPADLANTSSPDICWGTHDSDGCVEVYGWYGTYEGREVAEPGANCPN